MGAEGLYRVSYTGTKDLIEHYIDEVVYQLDSLSQTDIPGTCMVANAPTFITSII